MILDGRTYLPGRYMGYATGMNSADIVRNPVDSTAAFNYDAHTVIFTRGGSTCMEDGVLRRMDVAPIDASGRIRVPARYFGDAFGCRVSCDQSTREVLLSRK